MMTPDDAIQEIQTYMNSDCYLDAPSNEACKMAIKALILLDTISRYMEADNGE